MEGRANKLALGADRQTDGAVWVGTANRVWWGPPRAAQEGAEKRRWVR